MKLKRLRKFNHQATEQELSYCGILEILLNKSEYNLHGDGMHHHYLHRDGTGLPAVPSKDFLYLEPRHEAGSAEMPGREVSQPPQAEKRNCVRLDSDADSHQGKLLAATEAKSTCPIQQQVCRLHRTGTKVSPPSCEVRDRLHGGSLSTVRQQGSWWDLRWKRETLIISSTHSSWRFGGIKSALQEKEQALNNLKYLQIAFGNVQVLELLFLSW